MSTNEIYTIGHGSRKADDFINLLKQYGILCIVDVRSVPFSKFNPHFNQNELKFLLGNNGIQYAYMGDSLGGRPADPTCYDEEGKVDYDKVKVKDFFLAGIDRLKTASEKDMTIGIMCSESKPTECHRSKLIGRSFSMEKIAIKHIDEKGKIKTQAEVINELNKGLSDDTLFPGEVSMNRSSRKSYL